MAKSKETARPVVKGTMLPSGGEKYESPGVSWFKFQKEGDAIAGVIVGNGTGEYGEHLIIHTLDDRLIHVGLQNAFLETAWTDPKSPLKKGNFVGIEFSGKVSPKGGGNPYKVFEIYLYDLETFPHNTK